MEGGDKESSAFIVETFIENRFNQIIDFKKSLKSAIAREQDLMAERNDKLQQDIGEEELEKYYAIPGNYFVREDVFSEMSINPFIIVLYSYIEIGTNYLCRAGSTPAIPNIEKELRTIDTQNL